MVGEGVCTYRGTDLVVMYLLKWNHTHTYTHYTYVRFQVLMSES